MAHTFNILAPYSLHKAMLKKYRKEDAFADVKLYTKEDLISLYYGSFKKEAFIELVNKFNLSYGDAKECYQNLLYVEANCNDPKLTKLAEMKKYLLDNNLFNKPNYQGELEGINLIVEGYSKDDEMLLFLKEKLGFEVEFSAINTAKPEKNKQYLSFNYPDDELYYVYNKIAQLLVEPSENGEIIDPSMIGVYGLNDTYLLSLHRLEMIYHLGLNYPNQMSVIYLPIAKAFLKLDEFDETNLATLKEKYPDDYDDFSHIVKPYLKLNLTKQKKLEFFKALFLDSKVKILKEKSAIQIVEDFDAFEGKYLFILNFANLSFPKVYDSFHGLDEETSSKLHLTSNITLNNFDKERSINLLNSDIKLFITYHQIEGDETISLSPFASEFGMEKLTLADIPIEPSYCKEASLIYFKKMKEKNDKYRASSNIFNAYKNSLLESLPKPFDFKYKPFKDEINLLAKPISYSHIKSYFECRFKYFVAHVLKIKDYSETIHQKLGTLAHYVFEQIEVDKEVDFDQVFEDCFAKMNKDEKDRWKINELALKDKMKKIIVTNAQLLKKFYAQVKSPSKLIKEHQFDVDFVDNIKLTGKIDALVDMGDEYAIIDYKSSNREFYNDSLAPYGLSLQLPFYSLLLSLDKKYASKQIAGAYIRVFYPSSIKSNDQLIQESIENEKFNGLTFDLAGYKKLDTSLADHNLKRSLYFKGFGPDYIPSNRDKSIKLGEDASLNAQTKNLLTNAIYDIKDFDFKIDPKDFGSSNNSCTYCPYRDICFRKDEIIIKVKKGDDQDD